MPYYNVHKVMQGMLDQYLVLNNTQGLAVVTKMATYFYKRITHLIATNGTASRPRLPGGRGFPWLGVDV